jgi:pimeloyl-ACP methyl ester carboxylesterase
MAIPLGSTAYAIGQDEPKDAFFDSAGVKIHYVTFGEGEPVVLIHGFTGNARFHWAAPNGPMMKLGERYRVIAIDNRGHGLSDKPHDPEAYGAKMAEDVVRLLDHLDIRKAHLVGYSMGGFITMKVVTTYPGRVLSAVVGGAGWMQAVDDAPDSPLNRLADSLDKGEGFGPLFEALTPEGEKKPSAEQIRLRTQLIAASNDLKALAAVARAMSGLSVTESQLRVNRVPTLCFVGGIDPLKESADRLDGVMTHLEMQVLDGADHSQAARSPEFLKAVQAHLAEHSQSPVKAERTPAAVGG